mmetsp:Transcript_56185/g.164149  ORF Transcript_56185/g.164149 Transcript_56185/m.164149 type:complete len:211 (+) Transcript_56185:1453-2085(+)
MTFDVWLGPKMIVPCTCWKRLPAFAVPSIVVYFTSTTRPVLWLALTSTGTVPTHSNTSCFSFVKPMLMSLAPVDRLLIVVARVLVRREEDISATVFLVALAPPDCPKSIRIAKEWFSARVLIIGRLMTSTPVCSKNLTAGEVSGLSPFASISSFSECLRCCSWRKARLSTLFSATKAATTSTGNMSSVATPSHISTFSGDVARRMKINQI